MPGGWSVAPLHEGEFGRCDAIAPRYCASCLASRENFKFVCTFFLAGMCSGRGRKLRPSFVLCSFGCFSFPIKIACPGFVKLNFMRSRFAEGMEWSTGARWNSLDVNAASVDFL